MNDVRIVMVDGISQHNTSIAINTFIRRFNNEFNCQIISLELEYNDLIQNLRDYITNMEFKQNKYRDRLIEIFTTFSNKKKARVSRLEKGCTFTSNYSPFNINVFAHLKVIKEELLKFHGSKYTVDKIMSDIFKTIIKIEMTNEIPLLHRIVTTGFVNETMTLPIQRGEDDSLIGYRVSLYDIWTAYTNTNAALVKKFIHLRCPEYSRSKLDLRRLINEISLKPNIDSIFY